MIQFRPFRNSDPPLIAELWRNQPSQRGLMQPMSPALLEQLVLSRPMFDREGLILALGDHRALGFVHAGFGPNEEGSAPSASLGFASMVMVHGSEQESALSADLLARGEEYLRTRGTKQIYAGGLDFLAPFYLGLYGGSQLSGILRSDPARDTLFRTQGYTEAGRTLVLQRDLATFRPTVDRRQLQLRRRALIQAAPDPPPRNWWQACAMSEFTRVRFDLQPETGGEIAACVTFWNMEPLSITWGVHAAGLLELDVLPQWRRQGIATFLLGEAFRQLHAQGISLLEAHVKESNAEARQLFDALGFEEVDQATSYRKE